MPIAYSVTDSGDNDNSAIRFRMPLFNDLLNKAFDKAYKTNVYSDWGVLIQAKTTRNLGGGDSTVTVFVSEFEKIYHESDLIDIPVYTKGKYGNYVYNFVLVNEYLGKSVTGVIQSVSISVTPGTKYLVSPRLNKN